MNPERWRQVKEILDAALDTPTRERAAFLDEICGADEELKREVESFLTYNSVENGIFEEENLALEDLLPAPRHSLLGKQIGRYRITEEIGAGGMGAVFLAVRADGEFEQQVAVKFLRQSFASAEARRRFRQERQILARLRHPFIAQLIDGGTTDDATPYLVMEFVSGEPITKYAESRRLSPAERLDLFCRVCEAVAFSHRNLTVHRDLKPDNIMVTADGTPKLLDFGIAKLLSGTGAPTATRTQSQAFTPEYAAPEQMSGDAAAVTTATDVYSLGVIFYELLNGARPPATPTPSAATSNADRRTTAPHGARQTKSRQSKTFSSDLQRIAAKAMHRDPARRYSSVEQFAEDIRRYLKGLPINARPDTLGYRTQKFLQRHKFSVAVTALAFLFLGGAGVAVYRQSSIAEAERARAEQRFEETRRLAKAVIFDYHDEINKLAGATKVRSTMVTDALFYLDRLAADESATRNPDLRRELIEGYLRLGDVLGQPYGENLGDTEGAYASYAKALEILEKTSPAAETVADLKTRADVFQRMSQIALRRAPKSRAAVEYARRDLDAREKIAALAAGTENKIAVARSLHNLGWLMGATGELAASIAVLEQALALVAELLRAEPDNHELQKLEGRYNGRIAFHYSQMAHWENIFWNQERARRWNEAAVPHFEKAIETARKLSAAQPDDKAARRSVMVNESNLAEVLAALGRAEEALELQRGVLEYGIQQRAADPANREIKFEIAEDYLDLARTFVFRSEKRAAQENFERGMKMLDELLTADPGNTEFAQFRFVNLTALYGDALIETGDFDGALESYRRAQVTMENDAIVGEELKRENLLSIRRRFGDIHFFKAQRKTGAARRGQFAAAREFYRQALESIRAESSQAAEISNYLRERIAACAPADQSAD